MTMTGNSMKEDRYPAESTPFSEEQLEYLRIRKEMVLELACLSAPFRHTRDPATGKETIEIEETGEESRTTFEQFDIHYRRIGELLNELRQIREKRK